MPDKFGLRKRVADLCRKGLMEARENGASVQDIAQELGVSEGYLNNCSVGNPDGAILSTSGFIALVEKFRLSETIGDICRRAGGIFIKIPKEEATEADVIRLFGKLIKEHGDDAGAVGSLLLRPFSKNQKEAVIKDLWETIEAAAGLIAALEKEEAKNGSR